MDFRSYTNYPIGMRNNNLGNVKNFSNTYYVGQVGKDSKGHAIFKDMKFGVQAFANDVLYKIFQRNPKLNTISKIINVYAPASDGNKPNLYIDYVVKKSGINANETLPKNKATLTKLLNAMAMYEVGETYFKKIPLADINFGYNAAFNKYLLNAGSAASNATNDTVNNLVTLLIVAGVIYALKK